MKYFQLKEVTISDEMQPLTIYQGLEQEKIKLHQGYFLMKQAITALVSSANQQTVEYHVIYKFENETLTTIFGIPDTAEEALQSCMPEAVWEEVPYKSFSKPRICLVGSADPTVLEEREESLIESVINAFPKEDFIIDFIITVVNDKDIELYLAYLGKTIQVLSQFRSSQITFDPKIGEKIIKLFSGGLNQSLQSDFVNADISYMKYRQHFNAIHLGKYKCTLRVEVYANKANDIYNTFQVLSARSGFVSGHYLYPDASPNLTISRHKEPWLKHINVYDTSKQLDTIPGITKDQLKQKADQFIENIKRREFKEYPDDFKYISTTEAASILSLPFNAQTGLIYRKAIKYGTEPQKQNDEHRLNIGYLTTTYRTDIPVEIDIKDLTRHALVTGVTGSGKTTTIKHLLRQCLTQNIPFLVIEPAKSEYVNWIHEDISVHRLGVGNDSLKMNPLAFPKGIHVQTHLDNIKSVFNAAFPMYGPMPYLLETALLKAYQNRGWDLVTGSNIYEHVVPRDFCFPSIEELRDLIDQVTTSVGYSQDLTSDVRGALRVRLGSLMVGAKGQLFNTRQLIDLQRIMKEPTVLSLEAIGDSQEKVFLMGLLLIQIYEHYISQGSDAYTDSLKHLLIFEEAHRLWENRQEALSQETIDVKGNAVQTMNQILSEIRAYGQGILIADQIPSKLAPDAVKNTNLKIIHRLFAQDDRQWVGKSIGLNDDQVDDLVNLKTKEGVVFWDGLDKPVEVHIEVDKAIENNIAEIEEIVDVDEKEVIINVLMVSEEFNQAAKSLLRTILVFPSTAVRLPDEILKLVMKYYPKEQIHKNIVADLLSGLMRKQLDDWYSLGIINLIKHYESLNSIEQLTDTNIILEKYIGIWESITSSLVDIPVFHLVPQAKYISYLLPKSWVSAAKTDKLCNMLQNAHHAGQPITMKSRKRWRELNHILDLKSYFSYDIIPDDQKNVLTDAAVVSLIRDYTEIVDYYLDIVTHFSIFEGRVTSYLQPEEVKNENAKGNNTDLNDINIMVIQNHLDTLEALSSTLNDMTARSQYGNKILYYFIFFLGIVNIILALSIWIK